MFGSADLLDSLLKAGLVDEYRICVAPVVLGGGNPLFKPQDQEVKMRLQSARPAQDRRGDPDLCSGRVANGLRQAGRHSRRRSGVHRRIGGSLISAARRWRSVGETVNEIPVRMA